MKMPRPIEQTYRYCPECGVAAERIGEMPFRCTACGYAHFFGPVAAVGGLVVNRNGELLMVRRAQDPGNGKWGLPGGFVDPGETIEQALHREVLEETHLKITASRYLISYPNLYDYQGVVAPVMDLFFVCEVDADEQVQLDEQELDHFDWVCPSPSRLEQMAFPSNRRAIEYWMRVKR